MTSLDAIFNSMVSLQCGIMVLYKGPGEGRKKKTRKQQ